MSDSSEEEDLSRFRDVVDTVFVKLIDDTRGKTTSNKKEIPRSERYLEEATHYNDIKVSKELQKHIGAKVSSLIDRNIEFVNVETNRIKKRKIKSGVKLFRDSEAFLTCDDPHGKDIVTELHNKVSKKIKESSKRRHIYSDVAEPSEEDKINAVVVSGDVVLAKKTKYWRKKRRNILFEYKSVRNNRSKTKIIGVR